ncbi:MAG: hypothetical protein ABI528_08320, partial [bacterium]
GYGITEEVMSSYRTRIDKYARALGMKESSGAVKTGAFKSLAQLFKDGDSILETLDRLLEKYREENTEFYNGYKKARVLLLTGVRHRKDKLVAPEVKK